MGSENDLKRIEGGNITGGIAPPPRDIHEKRSDAVAVLYVQADVGTWENVFGTAKETGKALIAVKMTKEDAVEAVRRLQMLLRDADN